MKAHLLYRDRDFAPWSETPPALVPLVQDLELNALIGAMAAGSRPLAPVARTALLDSLQDVDDIRYRQDILADCLRNPAVVRELHRIAVDIMESRDRGWLRVYGFGNSSAGILHNSVELVRMFLGVFRELRRIADEHGDSFRSEGFTALFSMIRTELDDAYLATVQAQLEELSFRDGVLMSVRLGRGNEGTDYLLAKRVPRGRGFIQRVLAQRPPSYSFSIAPRDDHGARVLSELKERGINSAANALAQSADHINSFFAMLRTELSFYVACLNLYDRLTELGEPVTLPSVAPAEGRKHSFEGLYDVCLALTTGQAVVGNDMQADGRDLVIITGANQGGKTTFLRSVGLAQLMAQAGMFVPATSFSTSVCTGLFTHFRREEDATMKSGKLDEELGRMSLIVDNIAPHGIVLFNESFAATNEREGSEIAWQITRAMTEMHVKVFYVTHLYAFAHAVHASRAANVLFLRADRSADGERTFRLIEGEPLETSYGPDLYRKVFAVGAE